MNRANNKLVLFFSRMTLFISEKKELMKTIGLGQLIYSVIGWIYNNPLYMAVIALCGPFVGGGLMTLGSLLICLFLILWYNHRKIDWLGVNAIDSIKILTFRYVAMLAEWRTESFIGKVLLIICYIPIQIILSILRLANHRTYGDIIAFFLLSIFEDPFVTTAYLRHGYYEQMVSRDWLIFFGSVILSNGYWIFRTTAIIQLAQTFLKIF